MISKEHTVSLTKAYFVDGVETAMVELLGILSNIYKSRVWKYNFPKDIVEDGCQNLYFNAIRAARSFDITKNDDFIAYMDKCINGEVHKTLMAVKFPYISRENNKLLAATKYAVKNVPFEEIGNKTITQSTYKSAKELIAFTHRDLHDEEGDIIDIEDEQVPVCDVIDHQRAYDFLMWLIENLSEEDRYLIQEIYMNGRTLKQLGEEYNVSLQAIDCRVKRILKKLRKGMMNAGKFDLIPFINTDLLELQ